MNGHSSWFLLDLQGQTIQWKLVQMIDINTDLAIDGLCCFVDHIMSESDVIKSWVIVHHSKDLLPYSDWEDTRSPIPTILVCSLSSEWVIGRQSESVVIFEDFFLLEVVFGGRCEVDDNGVSGVELDLDFVSSEHVMGWEDVLPIQVNFSVGVQALEDKELVFGVEDGWCDIEGSLVGCVFGLILVEL